MAGEAARDPLRIKEGDTVILDVNDKHLFVTVKAKGKVRLGGAQVSVEPLLGCHFGSLFTLNAEGDALVRMEHVPLKDWDAPTDVSRNNANLLDRSENQQLTSEEIAEMKAAGRGGEEIIAALTASSATFATKTEFSQEKYRKKKAKKYIMNVVARRPTAAAICQAYYAKQPSRVGGLRLDALSVLLGLANVGAHARVLVLDACGGLVTGAVAERLGGLGSVTAAYVGAKAPAAEALRQFNFSPAARAGIRTAPLQRLLEEAAAAAAAAAAARVAGGEQPAADRQQEGQQQEGQQQEGAGGSATGAAAAAAPAAAADGPAAEAMQVDNAPQQEAAVADGAGAAAGPEGAAAAVLGVATGPQAATAAAPAPAQGKGRAQGKETGPWAPYTSCIIAAPALSPAAALSKVLPLLAPSASFAVNFPWMQPLADAMMELQQGRRAVGMQVQESWWRDYQVLPSRTHPLMSMNHGGGYLLSGTVVVAGEEAPRPGAGQGGGGSGQLAGRKRKA